MTTATSVTVHRKLEHVMGMPISLALRGRHADDTHAISAWASAIDALHRVDRVFSTYRADSAICRIDRGELEVLDAPPEVGEVLALAEEARIQSAGAFDIRRPGADGRVRLDPSGVVKGWAIERASLAFAELDDTDYCLSAGGDMVCHVADPDRPDWQIGIEDPHAPRCTIAVVPLRDGAVATSGITHRGAHIADARSGLTPSAVASVTVVAPSLTWADIDATAAFAQGPEALAWLCSRPHRAGLVVWQDGTVSVFGPSVLPHPARRAPGAAMGGRRPD